MRSKTSGMSKKGRSQRGCGNGSGKFTSPPPAAGVATSDAELSLTKSMVQQSHSVDCSLESRGRGPWQWWGYRRTWDGRDGRPYQCSQHRHSVEDDEGGGWFITKRGADHDHACTIRQWSLYQVLVTSLLRQCSHYNVVIKCLLCPHSTTSSTPSSSIWPHLSYGLVRSKREYYHNCSLVVFLCSFL